MFVNQAGSLPPKRSGPVEKVHKTFRRYNYLKPFSAGDDMEETDGKKIPGYGCVVAEICQTENRLPVHPRSDGEE